MNEFAELTEDRLGRVQIASVTRAALSTELHHAAVLAPGFGAVVTFSGVVRDHDDGRAVEQLDYVAHPDAQRVIGEIAAAAATRASMMCSIAVSHRVGPLSIGDEALVVAVAAAHRGEAFAVCSDIVEAVKAQLPVWKRQVFTDGTDEWVNCA